MNASEAEAQGFTIDRHCYPWVAYKGPRFAPTVWECIETPTHCPTTTALGNHPARLQNFFACDLEEISERDARIREALKK